jgi:hypothetical protein
MPLHPAHEVVYGLASRANGPRGPRERCHAEVFPKEDWPGNRLCHLPILPEGKGWRHETIAELASRGVTWPVWEASINA